MSITTLPWRSARRMVFATIALLAALVATPVSAIDVDDLLPVDDAFVLGARAPERGRIEIDWKIAEGYYLYRHRTSVQVEHGFKSNPLQLPAGKAHVDEFFGEVETYRKHLTAVLTGAAADGIGSLTLQVKYQGCADVGICYPPQTRTLTVALPAEARPANGGGLGALGRSLLGGAPAAGSGIAIDGRGTLPLPEEQAFTFEAIAGDGDTILMRFTPAKGYYLYRDRNRFEIGGAHDIRAGTPTWPKGVSHHDEHFGDVTVYFDRIDVPLPLVRSVADAAEVSLTATFQGCQENGICYPPMTRTVKVALPAGTVQSAPSTPPAAEVSDTGRGPSPDESAPQRPDEAAAGERGEDTGSSDTAPVAAGTNAEADNAVRTAPPATTPTGALPKGGLFGALLLALLGGLILNLMPCVLPILSLKVLGLAQSGESRAHARAHALWYTAGVLCAFAAVGLLVVALRAGGQALGWGFQLQQPWFVAALVYLMFAVGLSLSGVFTFGSGWGNVGQSLASKSGPAGDFFTGVLACVVASPCIAPFMGGALAFAFSSSALLALAVFLALGLGLALPFLLVGFVPALADRLPRPGAWMETLKQALAFPMYLTAIWLLWVLGKQRGVDAMALVTIGLALAALALWWHERKRWGGSTLSRALAIALLLASLLPIWQVARMAAPTPATEASEGHVAYSAERLQALRDEGRAVFVNMTADWCVTCKANERNVLSGQAFRDALRRADAVYMVGDWTNVDPGISDFLARHRAVGVPLYVVYPQGGGEGEVLPALLSDAIATAALERAAR